MLLSEAIEKLQNLKKLHGDIPVLVEEFGEHEYETDDYPINKDIGLNYTKDAVLIQPKY